jgi:hypothetical protein
MAPVWLNLHIHSEVIPTYASAMTLEVCLAFLYALGMTWLIFSMPWVQLGVWLWYDLKLECPE